jgi:hypothetical protein
LAPISDAAQNASNSINQSAAAFTGAMTTGFGLLQSAISNASSELQKQLGIALSNLHDLLVSMPDVTLPPLITINGKGIEQNPDVLYTTLRGMLSKSDPIIIQFRGPLAAPLQPLTDSDPHKRLRAVVLPAFGLPLDSAVLNSDPVTITVLIVITIIVLGFPLTAALGTAIAALFLALAAILIIAAIQGRNISVNTCPDVSIGANLPGGPNIEIPVQLCTQITIS